MNPQELRIITPSLNSASTLLTCLDSAATQSIDVEHVVIDGGSTDRTQSIIANYEEFLGCVIVEKDNGLYDAINKGIKKPGAEIIGLLHADDVFADNHVIASVIEAFSNPDIDAVYGDLDYVDRIDTDKVVRRWNAGKYSPRKFYNGWMPPHPTFFARKECFEKYGCYRLDMGTAADYELMLRFMLVNEINVRYIPRVLVKMRVGGASNATIRARLKANRMDRKAWAVNGLRPYPWTLLAKPVRKVGQWFVK